MLPLSPDRFLLAIRQRRQAGRTPHASRSPCPPVFSGHVGILAARQDSDELHGRGFRRGPQRKSLCVRCEPLRALCVKSDPFRAAGKNLVGNARSFVTVLQREPWLGPRFSVHFQVKEQSRVPATIVRPGSQRTVVAPWKPRAVRASVTPKETMMALGVLSQ